MVSRLRKTPLDVNNMTGNFVLDSAIDALAETLALGKKQHRSKQIGGQAGQNLFACPAYETYGRAIAQQRFRPAGFTVELGLKDIDLAVQTAADSMIPLPLASSLHARFPATAAKGRAERDWAVAWVEPVEHVQVLVEERHEDSVVLRSGSQAARHHATQKEEESS